MAEPEIAVTEVRHIAAPPAIVWALAADSNRVDRVLGAGRVTYSHEPPGIPGTLPPTRIGSGRAAGMPSTWIERGEWIEGRFIHAERRYLTGVLAVAAFRVDIAAEPSAPDRARLDMRAWLVPRAPLPSGPGLLQATMQTGLRGYLDALAALLGAGASSTGGGDQAAAAAAIRARRVLAGLPPDTIVSGKTTPVAADQLAYCAGRFRAAPVDPRLAERLLAFIHLRGDDELRQIRPFELARAWNEAPRAVLAAFLHAARAGLVDLRWELSCPSCRVAAVGLGSLDAARPQAHCDECAIDFDLDFARNVEAVFQVNPSIRAVDPRPYCGGSPWWRPHVFARVELAPAARREVELELPAGASFSIRAFGPRAVTALPPGAAGARVVVSDGGLTVEPAARPGLAIENQTRHEVAIHVERAEIDVSAATGVDVMTLGEFHDLFATDAPATGVDLTVGAITVLFSDLTDTTALYERIGDSKAFALVEEHFRRMSALVREHHGALIKTMGDAVMASFGAPTDALAAGLDMIAETRRMHGAHGLALKVGLHTGPALAVRANDQLDFFGSTVNLASRLQHQAHGDEIALAAELLEHPGLLGLIRTRGLVVNRQRVVLKGLREAQAIALVRAH